MATQLQQLSNPCRSYSSPPIESRRSLDGDRVKDDGPDSPKAQAWKLYGSHFLSTWNARTYEFAAILFTASAYPETLLASSIRGIAITLSLLVFSSTLGTLIDQTASRLRSLVTTIVINRVTIVCASLLWLLIVDSFDAQAGPPMDLTPLGTAGDVNTEAPRHDLINTKPVTGGRKHTLFAVILFFGMLERLSGVANTLSMERDWVPALASPAVASDGSKYDLIHINAVMRRIDLICKLMAPIIISFLITYSGSIRVGALTVAGMSGVSWLVEWWCAWRAWQATPALREIKVTQRWLESASRSSEVRTNTGHGLDNLLRAASGALAAQSKQLRHYFSTTVWLPSIALAILYVNVLNYAATFITYLLNVGFSLSVITIARAAGSVVEISSTLLAPWALRTLSRYNKYYEHVHIGDQVNTEEQLLPSDAQSHRGLKSPDHASLARLGLWGLTSQFLSLLPVTVYILAPSSALRGSAGAVLIVSPIILLFIPLTLSRLGLWLTDLSSQTLTTSLVPPHTTASFAGTEQSFIAFFELLQWVAAAVWSAPDDFWKLALGSLLGVGLSTAIWAAWLRGHRGHLVHWERCSGCVKGKV